MKSFAYQIENEVKNDIENEINIEMEIEIKHDKNEVINNLTSKERLLAIIDPLCTWYEKSHRSLPWRDNPTPYHVWISEIMLQQTRVEAVKPYYHRFMNRLPRIEDLANVEDDELLKLWEGLGYYSRARNLKKAAIVCMEQHDGKLPDSYEQLLKLPGIGSYTAGAISSIAYHLPVPAVDGNVLRVVSRILASGDDIANPKVKKGMEQLLQQVINQKRENQILDAGVLNQALMELGATVCIPNGSPLCDKCPLNNLCIANQIGKTMYFPVKAPKKQRRIEEKTVFLVFAQEEDEKRQETKILLHKRPSKGLLAGMYELPNVEGMFHLEEGKLYWDCIKQNHDKLEDVVENRKDNEAKGIEIKEKGTGKHIFTHVQWNMVGYEVYLSKMIELGEDWIWATKEQIENQYSIPSAFDFLIKNL